MKITLLGRALSTQHLYGYSRYGGVYMKPKGKDLKKSYIDQIKTQFKGKPCEGPVMIMIQMYRKGAELDIDNFGKLILDSCNELIRLDDKQIKISIVIKVEKDNNNPRIVIDVKEIRQPLISIVNYMEDLFIYD